MRYVPWVTIGLALLLAITPFGQQAIGSAIHNGEQLAQSMNRLVVMVAIAAMAAVAALEVLLRFLYFRRRRRA